MRANSIKKGWQIKTSDGTVGTMLDNKRGNIRMVELPLVFDPRLTDRGSVYVWDIAYARPDETYEWEPIQLTDKQLKDRKMVESFLL